MKPTKAWVIVGPDCWIVLGTNSTTESGAWNEWMMRFANLTYNKEEFVQERTAEGYRAVEVEVREVEKCGKEG